MAVWERLQRLPMSDDEKARIFGLLPRKELEHAMPAGLTDAVLAGGLRYRYLQQPPAPRARDHDQDEVAALAARVPEFPLDQQSTTEALESYLHDFTCLEGLVPVASEIVLERAPPLGLQKSPFFFSLSHLGAAIRKALQVPRAGSGELVANSRLLEFLDVFQWLNTFGARRLDYHLSTDNVETETLETSTQTARKRKRPDFLVEHPDFLCLLGEGKDDERKFAEARDEISAKLNVVPDWVFGNVNFMLAFAIAGFKTQLFVKRASAQGLESLTNCYHLSAEADRVELVLVTIKLYFLCLSICKRVVRTGLLPLFRKHARNFSTIELDGEGCVKTIEDWNEYTETLGVSLANVKKAYKIPPVDQLAYAISPPRVSIRGRYMVRTGPLGLPAEHKLRAEHKLTDEHECKSLAKDVLTALAALHEVNLVHRDVRLDNIIWWPMKECYVLIDLETVAAAGKKMADLLRDYTPSTLVRGKYVKSSDLHQLGVLLETLMRLNLREASTRAFVNALKGHQTTAKALLTHPWLER